MPARLCCFALAGLLLACSSSSTNKVKGSGGQASGGASGSSSGGNSSGGTAGGSGGLGGSGGSGGSSGAAGSSGAGGCSQTDCSQRFDCCKSAIGADSLKQALLDNGACTVAECAGSGPCAPLCTSGQLDFGCIACISQNADGVANAAAAACGASQQCKDFGICLGVSCLP